MIKICACCVREFLILSNGDDNSGFGVFNIVGKDFDTKFYHPGKSFAYNDYKEEANLFLLLFHYGYFWSHKKERWLYVSDQASLKNAVKKSKWLDENGQEFQEATIVWNNQLIEELHKKREESERRVKISFGESF